VALWSGWRMEKILISAHKQNLEFIAARFPEYMALYSETGSTGNGLEQTIAKVSTPGLLVWAKDPNGNILAKSSSLDVAQRAAEQSIALVEIPTKPKVFQLGDRYVVLCANPVSLQGKPIGKVYLSQDIIDDQRQLHAGLWGLLLVSCVAVLVLMGAIAFHKNHLAEMRSYFSQSMGGLLMQSDRPICWKKSRAIAFSLIMVAIAFANVRRLEDDYSSRVKN
jgi:hypothetical protein